MRGPLSGERELWHGRSLGPPGERYALTNLRIARTSEPADEILLEELGEVERTESRLDRLLGASTVIVHTRHEQRPPLLLKHIRHGAQLAALLDLAADGVHESWDATTVRAALSWEPRLAPHYRRALIGLTAVLVAMFATVLTLDRTASAIIYAPDDAVYPGGVKRDADAIVAFMEDEVMPWARQALAPIVGGADRVDCETCHGTERAVRNWQMPAVAALPKPELAGAGWETWGKSMDAQMRNAIYGYIAEPDKQSKAAYMREVVMPGMARLLHRPAYDFTKSYDYNRSRVAFGCYHCHRIS
jgi:hypothetical protein